MKNQKLVPISKTMKRAIFFISILFLAFNSYSQTQEDRIFKTAISYFTDGKYRLAEHYFKKYLFLFPESKHSLKSYDFLTKIALKNKNYLKAIKYLNAILKIFSSKIDIPGYYKKLADIYFQIGKYEKSLQYYNYVLIKFPDSPETEYAQLKIEQISILTSEEE